MKPYSESDRDDAYEPCYPDGTPMNECWQAKRYFAPKPAAKAPPPAENPSEKQTKTKAEPQTRKQAKP